MLSGDSVAAATEVAHRAGIEAVRGGCSPQDKLTVLRSLQTSGQVVAMVGDGLNDGPVLAGADISIAFGKAVPLAQAQADLVILGDDLTLVARTVLRAQRTLQVVRQNLWWALAYNAACVPLAVAGYLPAWLAGLGHGGQFATGCAQCHASRMARPFGGRCLMDILYLLIPLSVVLVFFILGGLWWAIDRGQFEDIEGEGERILKDSS